MLISKMLFKRKLLGLSQGDVADAVGIGRDYYSRIETGARSTSINNYIKIADRLGMTDAELGGMIREAAENRETLVQGR